MIKLLFFMSGVLLSCAGRETKSDSQAESQSQLVAEESISKTEELPSIDFGKTYPTKVLNLEEIADIEYIPLETRDDVVLDGRVSFVLKDKIIAYNYQDGRIFFFDRAGKYLNSFNHKGSGPKEYLQIMELTIDPIAKEVFIYDHPGRSAIHVYSFDGAYKRSLPIKKGIYPDNILNYDTKYLLANWGPCDYDPKNKTGFKSNPYLLLDKQTGKIIAMPISIENQVSSRYRENIEGGTRSVTFGFCSFYRDGNIILSDLALDTLYVIEDDVLTPILNRNFSAHNASDKTIIQEVTGKLGNLLFLSHFEKFENVKKTLESKHGGIKVESQSLYCDLETGEIFEPLFRLSTLSDQEVGFSRSTQFEEPNQAALSVGRTDRLVELNEEGKLDGKLKEVVSTLDEESNPVVVIAKYKK